MIKIVVSNDADTRFDVLIILDEIFIGDNGTIQGFSDSKKALRYADKNKIDIAFISHDFEPAGGVCFAKMLREKLLLCCKPIPLF